ncbi:hypothetical protein MMC17_008140 [Xylographa soralifera]|nr:hypothetical protein [Xylographa soralifera]
MEVQHQRMHAPLALPPSPSLTNPDMILPYLPRSRSSTPTGRRPLSPPSSQKLPSNPFAELFDGFDGVSRIDRSNVGGAPLEDNGNSLQGLSRPTLPGAWQTEEDLHKAHNKSFYNGTNANEPFGRASPALHIRASPRNDHELLSEAHQQTTRLAPLNTTAQLEKSPSPEPVLTDKKHLVLKLAKRYEKHDHLEPGLEDDETDPYLHAAEILANAKMKLSAMGGNLNRARSLSSSSSRPPIASRAANILQQLNGNPSTHTRMSSESTNVPTRSISLGGRFHGLLESLQEDDGGTSFRGSSIEEQRPYPYVDTLSNDRPESPRQITRARSRIELQDLQERMQELRGIVIPLKKRMEQDKMHRRSLQTLKTPSPFTVSRGWPSSESTLLGSPQSQQDYTESNSRQMVRPTIRGFSGISDPTTFDEDDELEDEVGIDGSRQDAAGPSDLFNPFPTAFPQSSSQEVAQASTQESQERRSIGSSPELDKDGGTTAEDNDICEPAVPAVEKHEDRPDAFNYESAFLYSGMGTFSRPNHQSLKIISPLTFTSFSPPFKRRLSQSSTGSAETTKPVSPKVQTVPVASIKSQQPFAVPERNDPPRKWAGHSRQNSKDSISTVNTFATAIESNSGGDDGHSDFDLTLPRLASSRQMTVDNLTPHGVSLNPQEAKMRDSSASAVSGRTQPRSTADPSMGVGQPTDMMGKLFGSAEISQLGTEDALVVEDIMTLLQSACRGLRGDGYGTDSNLSDEDWRQRLKEARQVLAKDLEPESLKRRNA